MTVQAERQKSRQQAESLSALASLWVYAENHGRDSSTVTLTRPNTVTGSFFWTVEGCEYQVSNSRVRSLEMWEWVTREQWVEGNTVFNLLTLTPVGALALWGDA